MADNPSAKASEASASGPRPPTYNQAVPASTSGDTVVELNVGGTAFATTTKTLTRFGSDHFLASLATEDPPVARDSVGRLFIDRDPTHFGHILNFLRDGRLTERVVATWGQELELEAEYFGLDILPFYLTCAAATNVNLKRLVCDSNVRTTADYQFWASDRTGTDTEAARIAEVAADLEENAALVELADRIASLFVQKVRSPTNRVWVQQLGREEAADGITVGGIPIAASRYKPWFEPKLIAAMWELDASRRSPLLVLLAHRHKLCTSWKTYRTSCEMTVRPVYIGDSGPSYTPEWHE